MACTLSAWDHNRVAEVMRLELKIKLFASELFASADVCGVFVATCLGME